MDSTEQRLFNNRRIKRLDLFWQHAGDTVYKHRLLGLEWTTKQMRTLEFLFAEFQGIGGDNQVEYAWRDCEFFHIMYKASLIKRIGCSSVFLTGLFWDIKRIYEKDPAAFMATPPSFRIY